MRLDALERRRRSAPARCTGSMPGSSSIAALVFVVIAVATPIGCVDLVRSRGVCAGALDRALGHSAARSGPALAELPGARRLSGACDRAGPSRPARYGLGRRGGEHPDQEQPGDRDHARAGGNDPVSLRCWRRCASWAFRWCWSPRSSSWSGTATCSPKSSIAWRPRGGPAPSGGAARCPGACRGA